MEKPQSSSLKERLTPSDSTRIAIILGTIFLFLYLQSLGNGLFEKAKQKCGRFDAEGGIVRQLSCAHGLVCYCIGAIIAFMLGFMVRRLIIR